MKGRRGMKLTVEIKDSKLNYEYQIGENTHKASKHISAESLILFSDLLKVCNQHYNYRDREWERDMLGKAWVEKQSKNQVTRSDR
jgi:hypothetical protein